MLSDDPSIAKLLCRYAKKRPAFFSPLSRTTKSSEEVVRPSSKYIKVRPSHVPNRAEASIPEKNHDGNEAPLEVRGFHVVRNDGLCTQPS